MKLFDEDQAQGPRKFGKSQTGSPNIQKLSLAPVEASSFGTDGEPLASRMRPRNLAEFVGQAHLLGPQGFLRRALRQEMQTTVTHSGLGSIILWGPPGTGKTTLARLLAHETQRTLLQLRAVMDGLKELRVCLQRARALAETGGGQARAPILFVDEIHRWNKAQQDALLPWLECGTVLLIGATTENPAFELNNALLSRARVMELACLDESELRLVLQRALQDEERGVARSGLCLENDAEQYLLQHSGGDARRLLNAVELLASASNPGRQKVPLGRDIVKNYLQRQNLYDRNGDCHYDTVSAFIKSVRGSDVDSALYWLQVMLQGGENPRFIWRRLLILTAEDIGLADPQALVQVQAAAQAFEYVGLPEGEYFLSQATIYLSLAPKSNSVGAFWQAKALLRERELLPVPPHLREQAKSEAKRESVRTSVRAACEAEHGYLYPHRFPGHWVEQNYSHPQLLGQIYRPGYAMELQGWEAQRFAQHQVRLEIWHEAQRLEQSWHSGQDLLDGLPQEPLHEPLHGHGPRSEDYYQNRHEILLLWQNLREELAKFGMAQGWSGLSINVDKPGNQIPGDQIPDQVPQPSPEFLLQEWQRRYAQSVHRANGIHETGGKGRQRAAQIFAQVLLLRSPESLCELKITERAEKRDQLCYGLLAAPWKARELAAQEILLILDQLLDQGGPQLPPGVSAAVCELRQQCQEHFADATAGQVKWPNDWELRHQWQLGYSHICHARLWRRYARQLPESLQQDWFALQEVLPAKLSFDFCRHYILLEEKT